MGLSKHLYYLFMLLFLFSGAVSAANQIWFDEPQLNSQLQNIQIQSQQTQNKQTQNKLNQNKLNQKQQLRQLQFRKLRANLPALKSVMAAAPGENTSAAITYIELPMPDGAMRTFSIEESPILSPEFSKQLPGFNTYRINGVENSLDSGRLDLSASGFHAYITTEKGVVIIDPEIGSVDNYRSFYKRDFQTGQQRQFSCRVGATNQRADESSLASSRQSARISNELVTYRLAVAATREYSLAVANGDPTNTLNAIATVINRVNEVYSRDLGIFLQLVVDTDLVAILSDDFTNDVPEDLIYQAQPFIDDIIGSAAYDIGHVFSTGAGGLASLGVVCDSDATPDPGFPLEPGFHKAQGVTGILDPVGDPFAIDFVAHEIGHQFNATHSFNGTTQNCGSGNRTSSSAYEPGSGSTIMAYAGICGAEDVQSMALGGAGGASEDTFHAASIEQIIDFSRASSGNACGSPASTGNTAPTSNAGVDYIIPVLTPFELTGSASDVDVSDVLSYQWDEMDLGTETNAITYGTDLGSNPLFRSFAPLANALRTLPAMPTLVSGISDKSETLPEFSRVMNFRLTVRDQNSGIDQDDMQLTVNASSGPFTVLTGNATTILNVNQPQVVEWNAACTEMPPINCADVDILLSTDSGSTFTILKTAVANDGEETVNFPDVNSSTAVLKIACSNNIFFDISDQLITLQQGSGSVLVSTGAGGSFDCGTSVESTTTSSSSGGGSANFGFLLYLFLCQMVLRRAALSKGKALP